MNFRGTLVIKQEEKWFVATCLENNIASQGKTIDEAVFNLKEAISLYYEDEIETEEITGMKKLYNLLEEGLNDIKTGNILSKDEMDKSFDIM